MNSSDTQTFASLFENRNKRFEIPSYQRAYSWEKKEIDQFLTDLSDSNGSYYLGHYLFEVKDESTFYVIDGQQRLTTCIIFFSSLLKELAIRASRGESVSPNFEKARGTYLIDATTYVQKLETVKNDKNFFTDEVIRQIPVHTQIVDTKSKGHIRNARIQFDNALSNVEVSSQELERWGELVANASVTHLIVTDKVKAAQIFAFQNDRGKKLSDLELIKSYFMLQLLLSSADSIIINADIRYVEDEFATIYTKMVRVQLSEDNVLAYYWRAISNKGYDSPKVVAGVKESLKKISSVEKVAWIRDFVSGLAQAFAFVEQIESERYPYAEDLRNLDNMALAYPILFRAYKAGAERKDIERVFRFLENITFRYLLRGGRADIQQRLNQLLKGEMTALNLDAKITSIVADLKAGGWWWYWTDQSMKECLVSDFYQNRVDNYLLWKYELHISNKHHPRPVFVSYQDLISNESIEHIAPQTPTDDNPLANGYGIYKSVEHPDEGIQSGGWLNRLGNLMLISQSHNSSIGNRDFEKKLASYGTANLLMQQKEISDFLTPKSADTPENKILVWDKASIERRHKKMIAAALEIWSLDKI